MKIGCPPTPPKARAGLLTPPGMSWQARSKASWLRVREGFIGEIIVETTRRSAGLNSAARQNVILCRDEDDLSHSFGLVGAVPLRSELAEILPLPSLRALAMA